MQRTNFYKLPIKDLEQRVKDLRNWWWDNQESPKRNMVSIVLREAYDMLQNRKAIAEDPVANKQIADAIDIFWGDVPEKYEEPERKKSKPITQKQAKEWGLQKKGNGWLFDPVYYRQLQEAKNSPKGLV